jgi:hypothetical protein
MSGFYRPPARPQRGQCLAIWLDTDNGLDQDVARALGSISGGTAAPDLQPATIEVPMHNGWGRTIRFKYQLFGDGVGSCH